MDKVLLPKDYIRYRMTGEFASDMSDSSGTYWLDVAKRQWSDDLLRASDMRREQMPRLCEGTDATGRLTAAVAKAWGMPKRPVVAGGGGDNAASACGIGAVTDGAAFVSIGTSGVMFVSNDKFRPNAARRGSCVLPCGSRHMAPDGGNSFGNGQPGMAGRCPENACATPHQGLGHKTFRAFIGAVPALSFRRAHAGG